MLNIFNSNWENQMTAELKDIGHGLDHLNQSLISMEASILDALNELKYVIENGFDELSSSVSQELKSINSSISLNNLLTGIQAYQGYKINKNTKRTSK